MVHVIKRGLDLPINGQPVQTISVGPAISSVALLGDDYVGMRPTMLVKQGDSVKLGQPIFEDKKTKGIVYTSPGCGIVDSINRGEKRKFESIIINLEGEKAEKFESYEALDDVSNEQVRQLLIKSGEWAALRTRPYSKVPVPDSSPSSIFVTAIDSNPSFDARETID